MVGFDINVVLKQLDDLKAAVGSSVVQAAYVQGMVNGAVLAAVALIAAYLLTGRAKQ